MSGCAVVTANEPKEEEEEENAEGNRKQPERNPVGGESRLGKRKRGKGTLGKGGGPGRVCNGDGKQAQGG